MKHQSTQAQSFPFPPPNKSSSGRILDPWLLQMMENDTLIIRPLLGCFLIFRSTTRMFFHYPSLTQILVPYWKDFGCSFPICPFREWFVIFYPLGGWFLFFRPLLGRIKCFEPRPLKTTQLAKFSGVWMDTLNWTETHMTEHTSGQRGAYEGASQNAPCLHRWCPGFGHTFQLLWAQELRITLEQSHIHFFRK